MKTAKKCRGCEKVLPLSKFRKESRTKDGKASRCYRCLNATYRTKYAEKSSAWRATEQALRRGRLKRKPCVVCGAAQVEAHHADYSKPLDVTWLCHKHHTELHRSQRRKSAAA